MKYCFLFLALLSFQINFAQDFPSTLPDFEVFTLEEEPFTQDQVKKNTYIYLIYFSPTCGHCQDAFKFLNLRAEKIGKAEVQLYPVSSNTTKETLKFFDIYAPKIQNLSNVHILRDNDFKFAEKFGVAFFPTSFLYDQDGELVKVYEEASEILFFLNELD